MFREGERYKGKSTRKSRPQVRGFFFAIGQTLIDRAQRREREAGRCRERRLKVVASVKSLAQGPLVVCVFWREALAEAARKVEGSIPALRTFSVSFALYLHTAAKRSEVGSEDVSSVLESSHGGGRVLSNEGGGHSGQPLVGRKAAVESASPGDRDRGREGESSESASDYGPTAGGAAGALEDRGEGERGAEEDDRRAGGRA